MALIITVAVVFVLLVGSELWYRRRRMQDEFSRKFVHVTVGSFVAFWPYFLSGNQIRLLSLAFLLGVLASKHFHIFRAIHSVQRPTMGEVWFALMAGLLITVAPHHPHVYTAALLEMSLADGLAAVLGIRYGNSGRYIILGSPKSIVGTLTFFVTSCLILAAYAMWASPLSLGLIISISVVATALENIAAWGLDNIVVPLFVAGALLFLT